MNLEQRLQHAARELRELPVETPPLFAGAPSPVRGTPTRRIPALVAPVLFALGGLVMVAGGLRNTTAGDAPDSGAVPTAIDATTPARRSTPAAVAPITAEQELRIIAALAADAGHGRLSSTDGPPIVPPGPIGVV